jgi:pimeloyl-ACP methyl ester carboxylesterase
MVGVGRSRFHGVTARELPDLDNLNRPGFLWHGTADTLVPVSSARAFAKLIPGCEAHFIQDAGHMLLGSKELSSEMMGRIASMADKDDCPIATTHNDPTEA